MDELVCNPKSDNILKDLYVHFKRRGDELSLDILSFLLHYKWNCLLASFIEGEEDSLVVEQFVKECKEAKRVFLYGAGIGGNNFCAFMEKIGVEVIGFIDSFKKGEYLGKPIISIAEYKEKYDGILICIAVGDKYIEEVKQTLIQNGIEYFVHNSGNAYDKDSVFHSSYYTMSNYASLEEAKRLKRMSGTPQYFSLKELPHAENEIFVDCGCYNGENVRDFFEWSEGKGSVIAFEPDTANYTNLKIYMRNYPNCKIYKYGVGEKHEKVHFMADQDSSCHIDPDGNVEIEVVTMDELLADVPVTFIKMDIEGSELAALRGAKDIIRRYAPKLAICVYHKESDIWEIPEFIWSIQPNYDFYLRHYEDSYTETVLYAIPKKEGK